MPDAQWICADVFDWRDWWTDELGGQMFDYAIGNPPFGRVRRCDDGPRYRGADFEYHVIDIASQMADFGTFIVPQQSASFQYSGRPFYERKEKGRAVDFEKLTGLVMEGGAGVDTAIHARDWKDTNIITEIVCFEFAEARQKQQQERERMASRVIVPMSAKSEQLALL